MKSGESTRRGVIRKAYASSPRERGHGGKRHTISYGGGYGGAPRLHLHEKQLQPFTNDAPTNVAGGILFFRARRTKRMSTRDNRIRHRI